MEAIRNPKLAEVLHDHIEQLILAGALRPGERLASERDLAERLKVSRMPLREAIDRLEKRGLLTTTAGGTYVAEFLSPLTTPLASLMQVSDQVLVDYFEYRRCVEGVSSRFAAERATEVERDAIRACMAALVEAHKLDDPSAEAELDADLHMLIYEASHNLVFMHVMRAFSAMLRGDIFYNRRSLYVTPGIRDVLLKQHLNIGEAILARDPDRAEAAAAEHIRFTAETLEKIRLEDQRLEMALKRFGRSEMLSK